ncbi:hypothetical protein Kfla_6987 [Kribbella flavida DSM 17836]|uniref:DUF4913 domain-containing protein n=1 Tax=Kribbella flavida (strain DSM 17836 / JCM 10339 / NBRC 14399) TaxID=479435 RepID=D2Q3V3_KRIFD|nr:DUF4913 domain-containing protein [Kribbella flavida]ADB35975.1 hypothetical protein Kfla_6987 [Kribbella flavida DSM 17836]
MDDDDAMELYYPHVAAFVEDRLVYLYSRRLGQTYVWCPEWFRHAEALSRLDSIWRAWEHLRLDPATGMSVWWRDHADPHMMVLLSPDGPFAGCRGQHSEYTAPPLATVTPPEGLFFDQRDPELRSL